MTDTKDLLAQASAELDAERMAQALALNEAEATIDSLIQQANGLRGQIADLQEQLAAIDPWAGVDKTGATDVTAAVQKLLDAGLTVPAGKYLIDPVKGLIANRSVTMDKDAVLVAKPNNAPRYAVLTVLGNDLALTGGQILGDRLKHTYITGSTSEWGCGLMVVGDRCTVDGLIVAQCTGDGIEMTGDNCIVRNVFSTQNRRQGMSVFGAPGLKAYDSAFTNTGALLTDAAAPNGPCAGVDIEPDVASMVDAYFERCTFTGNRAGLLSWLRSEVGGSLNITMKDCITGGNANGINAKALAGKINITVTGGKSDHDRASAAKIDAGAALDISNVQVLGLPARYALQAVNGGVLRQSGMTYA